MYIEEKYELPFESEYEWRSALFSVIKDLYTEATLEILNTYKEEDCTAEWKDTSGLLNFAFNEKIIAKITASIENKATVLSI